MKRDVIRVRVYIIVSAFIGLLMLATLSNYMVVWNPTVPSTVISSNFEAQLAASESHYPQMKKDVEKKIFWADPIKKNKTEIALVYLHGFSATRHEISPVMETLAQQLKANLFMTRLAGHGLDGEAFGQATAQDWIDDAHEAYSIGKQLGNKVVIVGMSTGAQLALHLSYYFPEIGAEILISPNFFPKDSRTTLFTGPIAPLLARVLIGKTRSFQAKNAEQEYFWTTSYSSMAIVHLMDLVKYSDRIPLEEIKVPTLVLYTDKDDVVNLDMIKGNFPFIGAKQKSLQIVETATDHVLAGNIMSPQSNDEVIQKIKDFVVSAIPE